MTNFGAKILDNSKSALAAIQAGIAVTSQNIANVNTPNYARRVAEFETRTSRGNSGDLAIGNGVQIGSLTRVTDSYLDKAARDAMADKNYFGVQSELLSRLEQHFDITGNSPTIGSALTGFFGAVSDLSADPSSIPLRANLIQRANDLVGIIQTTYNAVANLQEEADQRLVTEVQSINVLTSQIADMNSRVAAKERLGSTAADERDTRDKLLEDLAKKISFSSVEDAQGNLTISLSNGFALVSGAVSRNLSLSESPSFATTTLPPSLKGGLLNYIVYDYDSSAGGESHIDLTGAIKSGGGDVGGLLALRGYNDPSSTSAFQADGSLVQIASRVESLARELLTTINQTYLGPDRNPATVVHDPSSGDLDGNNPAVYGLFSFTFSGARDANSNGLPDDLSALNVDSFARILNVAISDPRDVAAARDSGTGFPAAAVYAPGDGRNLVAVGAIQHASQSFSQGNYSFSGTFDQQYAETISYVGIQTNAVRVQTEVAEDKLISAQNSRDEVSGVSLDEEFSLLIRLQKAFQAAAKMLRTTDELLDQIVGLV